MGFAQGFSNADAGRGPGRCLSKPRARELHAFESFESSGVGCGVEVSRQERDNVAEAEKNPFAYNFHAIAITQLAGRCIATMQKQCGVVVGYVVHSSRSSAIC